MGYILMSSESVNQNLKWRGEKDGSAAKSMEGQTTRIPFQGSTMGNSQPHLTSAPEGSIASGRICTYHSDR